MIEFSVSKSLMGADGPIDLRIAASIGAGAFVTLFGPSGAGKTTLLRMLAGLVEPEDGRIVVDGEVWFDQEKRISLPPKKRSIGFVFQDYALFPNMSVRENLLYAAGESGAGWVDELLELVGLSALQARRPDTLSGGQKQRVALVRAIARRPKLLLLDEPLSALDLELRGRLQDDLTMLHRRFGLTTILVSHDVGEVFKLSQRVLCLELGQIVREGAPSEVFLKGRRQGEFNLHAQILEIRQEEVVYVATLLIGQEIVEVIATREEAKSLKAGDYIWVASKAFSPTIRPLQMNSPLPRAGEG